MKKLIALLCAAMMIVLAIPMLSLAETGTATPMLSLAEIEKRMPVLLDGEIEPAEARTTYKYATVTFRVPVTRYYENLDGGYDSVTVYLPAATAKYSYFVERVSGTFSGGAMINSTYPKITAVKDSRLNAAVTKVSQPNYKFETLNGGESYSLNIAGGLFTITYNNELYYDLLDNLIRTSQTTVRRTHNYTVTGP